MEKKHWMLPTSPPPFPPCEQTNACKNIITFPPPSFVGGNNHVQLARLRDSNEK